MNPALPSLKVQRPTATLRELALEKIVNVGRNFPRGGAVRILDGTAPGFVEARILERIEP